MGLHDGINKRVEGGIISDNDLKTSWATLQYVKLDSRDKTNPLPIKNELTKEDHWVGGSSIGDRMVYFVVSDEMMEEALFGYQFKKNVKDSPNTHHPISSDAKNSLKKAVTEYRQQFVHKILIMSL